MKSTADQLFQLTTSLSKIKNPEQVIPVFIDELNLIFPKLSFSWSLEGDRNNIFHLPVEITNKLFGFIIASDQNESPKKKLPDILHSTTEMLAFILEKFGIEKYCNEYKLVEEHIADVLWTFDTATMKFLYVSPSILKQRGFTQEECLAQKIDDAVTKEKKAAILEIIRHRSSSLHAGEIDDEIFFSEEVEQVCKNGSTIWTEIVTHYFLNKHTGHVEIHGVSRDIQEKKRNQEALLESERKYSNIFENVQDVFYQIDLNGKILDISPSIKYFSDFNKHELIGTQVFDLYYDSEDRTIFLNAIKKNRELRDYELRIKTKTGELKYSSINARLIFNTDGTPSHIDGAIRDITARKQAEKDLAESEEKYRSLIENSENPIFSFNPDETYRFVNYTFAKPFGKDPKEIIGKTPHEIFPLEEAEKRLTLVRNVFATGVKGEIEVKIVTVSREEKYFLTMVDPIKDETGKILWVSCLSRDITERKLAEIALAKSEELYRLLADHMTDTIWLMDLNLKTYYISPSIEKIRGYTLEEIALTPLQDQMPPESFNRVMIAYAEEMERLKVEPEYSFVRSLELEFYRKDGSKYWSENTFSLVRDNAGNPISIIGEGRDITLRKIQEEELIKLSQAVEQSPLSIIIADRDGKIEYANSGFTKSTGYNSHEIIGVKANSLLAGATPSETIGDDWAALTKRDKWEGEVLSKKKNGDVFFQSMLISPIRNKEGETLNYLLIMEDITEKKQMIKDLILAKEKAEEMNNAKSNFYANMSHELRTPMIGVLGYAELLKEFDDEKVKNFAGIIFKGGQRLMETLNLILNMSRIESNQLEMIFSKVEVVKMINDTIKLFQDTTSQKQIFINSAIGYDSLSIETEEMMLKQILNNLINNAVKYTGIGGVNINLFIENNTEQPTLIIEVRDTGIGIAEEHKELIWEEFRQVSEGRGRSFEGTGLGLSITKKFVTMLKGEISVQSQLGIGSIFTVKIPVNIVDEPSKLTATTPLLSKSIGKEILGKITLPKILYVEDDNIAFSFAKILLNGICILERAKNSEEALKKAAANLFQLILMDINLGHGADGTETTRILRQIPEYSKTPIVAITAFAADSDKNEFLSAGCSHYLSKPYNNDQLLQIIAEALGSTNN